MLKASRQSVSAILTFKSSNVGRLQRYGCIPNPNGGPIKVLQVDVNAAFNNCKDFSELLIPN